VPGGSDAERPRAISIPFQRSLSLPSETQLPALGAAGIHACLPEPFLTGTRQPYIYQVVARNPQISGLRQPAYPLKLKACCKPRRRRWRRSRSQIPTRIGPTELRRGISPYLFGPRSADQARGVGELHQTCSTCPLGAPEPLRASPALDSVEQGRITRHPSARLGRLNSEASRPSTDAVIGPITTILV
jgi:hypothetical protein